MSSRKISNSTRSGLVFPVSRIITMLRVRGTANRISTTGGIYLTAVLEYLTAEILELALNVARSEGSRRIQPRHLNIALRKDMEFLPLFRRAIFPRSTFFPVNSTSRRVAEEAGTLEPQTSSIQSSNKKRNNRQSSPNRQSPSNKKGKKKKTEKNQNKSGQKGIWEKIKKIAQGNENVVEAEQAKTS